MPALRLDCRGGSLMMAASSVGVETDRVERLCKDSLAACAGLDDAESCHERCETHAWYAAWLEARYRARL